MVIHLRRRLETSPQAFAVEGVRVIEVRGKADRRRWLAVQNEVFAPLAGRTRPWTMEDVARELAERPGGAKPRAWLAVEEGSGDDAPALGAVALGPWMAEPRKTASIGWLAVRPAARRCGVGRLLLCVVEAAAREAGYEQIIAETSDAWHQAVAFYQRMGYAKK